jgi:hypothetical protein
MAAERTVSIHQHQVIQQRVDMLSLLPKRNACLPVVNVGRMHVSPQQMPHRIDHQKPLAALDKFTAIKPNLFGGRRGVLDALRVDHGYCWDRLFVHFKPMKYRQLVGNQYPGIVFAPFPEVPVNSLPWRKTIGQIAPDDAVFGQIKDGFDNASKGPNAFSFDINEFFNTLPLRGRQVGGIRLLHTT